MNEKKVKVMGASNIQKQLNDFISLKDQYSKADLAVFDSEGNLVFEDTDFDTSRFSVPADEPSTLDVDIQIDGHDEDYSLRENARMLIAHEKNSKGAFVPIWDDSHACLIITFDEKDWKNAEH